MGSRPRRASSIHGAIAQNYLKSSTSDSNFASISYFFRHPANIGLYATIRHILMHAEFGQGPLLNETHNLPNTMTSRRVSRNLPMTSRLYRNELPFVSKRSFHRFQTNFKTLPKRNETNLSNVSTFKRISKRASQTKWNELSNTSQTKWNEFSNDLQNKRNRKRNFVWLQTLSKRKWN